ncbi:MAG: carbamoyl phosphate synthase small subunit [Clostridiales bacterium]|nr:carbamoyl phosphate synthase small subunit [Clostridiales bacterium]
MEKAYIILENGRVFEGKRFGASGSVTAELVFTTGVVGYTETLTDPSYYGQMVMQTFPLIGNYGVITADFESAEPALSAYIVREYCEKPSNFRCEMTVDEFLRSRGIPGVWGVDTREITMLTREHGVMNARITSDPDDTAGIADYRIKDAVAHVSCREKYTLTPDEGDVRFRVALYDFGEKRNIERELLSRGCAVTVLPYDTPAEEVLSGGYDGVMLSNGPGDPAENIVPIENIKKLLGKLPIFGICLGHQLTAIAAGGRTVKLKYGHRGANQPVRSVSVGRTYISTQNHGYAVDASSIPPEVGFESFVNVNDGTNEGMDYPSLRAFTVQFHPEACAGPKDSEFLFDRFVGILGQSDGRK